MTVQEVRSIREKKSAEWACLSPEQRDTKIKNGAKQMQVRIEKIRLNKSSQEESRAQ